MFKTIKPVLVAVTAVLAGSCSSDGSGTPEPEEIDCWIVDPAADTILLDVVDVQVALQGPVASVELLLGDLVITSEEVADGSESVTLSWDTALSPDGPAEIAARAMDSEGAPALSEPVAIVIDNTPPVVSFGPDLPRFSVIGAEHTVPLVIEEANVAGVVVLDGDTEILTSDGIVDGFSWDTTTASDGIHLLSVEVTDIVGRTAEERDLLVIVANNGEERTVVYDPSSDVTIPENFLEVEYHVRGSATGLPDVRQVITWLTWDSSAGWTIEYAMGQGLCPHRGISYLSESSDGGEIVLSLRREELAPWIVARLPAEYQDSDVFPYNGDPLTFGAFFGHVAPLDPSEHVGETLPIEIGMVFFY